MLVKCGSKAPDEKIIVVVLRPHRAMKKTVKKTMKKILKKALWSSYGKRQIAPTHCRNDVSDTRR